MSLRLYSFVVVEAKMVAMLKKRNGNESLLPALRKFGIQVLRSPPGASLCMALDLWCRALHLQSQPLRVAVSLAPHAPLQIHPLRVRSVAEPSSACHCTFGTGWYTHHFKAFLTGPQEARSPSSFAAKRRATATTASSSAVGPSKAPRIRPRQHLPLRCAPTQSPQKTTPRCNGLRLLIHSRVMLCVSLCLYPCHSNTLHCSTQDEVGERIMDLSAVCAISTAGP